MLIKFPEDEDNDDLEQLEDLPKPRLSDMYDCSPDPGEDGLYGLSMNDGLTEKEKQLSPLYAQFSRGLLIVTGIPGSGKGTFGNHLVWRLRRFFKGKKVLLDYKPKPVFDLGYEDNKYHLVNGDFILDEIDKMAKKAGTDVLAKDGSWNGSKKVSKKEATVRTQLIAKDWTKQNEVLLQNGAWVLDEFKRYLHNRQPMNPVGIQIANIIAVWRHLDLLILGMCPNINEIDAISCLPYMTHEVKTSWGTGRLESTAICRFYRTKIVSSKGNLNVEGKPSEIKVDGKKPRPEIGVELIPNVIKAEGNVEQDVLDFLREDAFAQKTLDYMNSYKLFYNSIDIDDVLPTGGCVNLNMICDNLGADIDEMNERLIYMHEHNIVKCKGFFDLFNSKNYANLKPKLGRSNTNA